MKMQFATVVCMSLCIIFLADAYGSQDVGGDFGKSWLEQHGMPFSSSSATKNSLWDWGNAPKGYAVVNGVVFPPGYGTQFYYPSSLTNAIPIIINSTSAVSNSPVPNYQSSISEANWLQAQLTGRTIAVINNPNGPLF